MHPSDGSCQQQTDLEIGKRIASFTWVEKFILVAGAGKPFAFLSRPLPRKSSFLEPYLKKK
jgi:hypothetical protein